MSTRRLGLTRLRHEGGASAVEFAILAPLFFMIVFGMFSGGIAYNQRNQLTHAAREGSRYGAAVPVEQFDGACGGNSGGCWANNIRDVTIERAFGDLGATVPGRRICVALVEGTPGSVVSLAGSGTYWSDTAGGAPAPCYNDGGADAGRRVQVRVLRNGRLNAVLFGMNLTLSSQSSAKFEQD